MSPGLIDGHIHIESTFLSPTEFCNMVAHGIDYILQSTHNQPVKVYLMMPSCVPATNMETSGVLFLQTT